MVVRLEQPSAALLPAYADALSRGWHPSNSDGPRLAAKHLAAIAADPVAFLASLHDPNARGAPITLPDGTKARRLPGYTRWISDGAFCGAFCGMVNFRWQSGTPALPSTVSGHIGYGVVPWKRGRGIATRALALILDEARGIGLAHVELTTQVDNAASARVITANGGIALGHETEPEALGGREIIRYRIVL